MDQTGCMRLSSMSCTWLLQVTGKCGSVSIRLVPAPRGAGIVAARVPKKVLQMAGIEDCYTSSRGCRKTLGNFVKATFNALAKTYGFLTPDLWRETKYTKSPLQVRRRPIAFAWGTHAGHDGTANWGRFGTASSIGHAASQWHMHLGVSAEAATGLCGATAT